MDKKSAEQEENEGGQESMIRDITIGQYYPADSVLHKMDPRAKLVGTLVFIISVFVFHTFPGYAVATIFLAAMIILSKVPVKFMFKGLKAIVMLLMITVVFNIFLTPGKVLWQWGILHVTEEGLKLAGRMAIRLTLSGDRFFSYDADYHTQSAYRWSGTTSQAVK